MTTTPNVTDNDHLIRENVKRHERIASQYDKLHAEIYNDVEQDRLRAALSTARSLIIGGTEPWHAMDYGCGAGNLTHHLLDLGFTVTAADVTPSFVSIVKGLAPDRVTGHVLNGKDLQGIDDGSLDLIATYSVLHHVPDYLMAVKEFARVVRPGGVIFIDHESSRMQWSPTPALRSYWERSREPRSLHWYTSRLFSPYWLMTKFRQLFEPRYAPEGDIHVWPDDHVEWDAVEAILRSEGCQILVSEDYLLYQPHVPPALYDEFRTQCADMHCCIARKT